MPIATCCESQIPASTAGFREGETWACPTCRCRWIVETGEETGRCFSGPYPPLPTTRILRSVDVELGGEDGAKLALLVEWLGVPAGDVTLRAIRRFYAREFRKRYGHSAP